MNWYKKAMADRDWIFGYVGQYGETDAVRVPDKYAKTYGEKNGLTHLDLFGQEIAWNANYTWRFKDGTVYWYGNDIDNDLKFAVENILHDRFGEKVVKHASY